MAAIKPLPRIEATFIRRVPLAGLSRDAELTEASQMESLEEILRPRGTLFVGCSVPS
ncbi:hypothetical protein PGT21_031577 [Puccinia graminis f. sp. tritici]|uniref:Uncharacterized protein n=1 Tax=Puccinia graminis f. sp. tritici TaxID=56615 RepID=A0A5B0QBZ9_PUCGR|nr:hypothetical protein PGT21_031577 [Puccinia graminis f. sp. tritici]